MPELPRNEIQIVVQPSVGQGVSEALRFQISRAIVTAAHLSGEEARQHVICANKHQNIIMICTPSRKNAERYAAVSNLTVYGAKHEVGACESAPRSTVKGVIREVLLTDSAQEINDFIVPEYNSPTLHADNINKSMSVVIAFEGPKVPNN
ncbi:hypothetical protein HPB48_011340 [Haemaphysalis longicornis]|uniref:Uncharacterized protein n=1 Tax=Haemaphysalis longicornis TaxID=44386 RepID=A0A9J6GX09_HAELO|nr:hypothetical protein HPB48_011340 [Haemaphysalis longicornis]